MRAVITPSLVASFTCALTNLVDEPAAIRRNIAPSIGLPVSY